MAKRQRRRYAADSGAGQRRSAADRRAEGRAEADTPDHRSRGGAHDAADDSAPAEAIAPEQTSRWRLPATRRSPPRSHSPSRSAPSPAPPPPSGCCATPSPSPAAADATRALQNSVAQLGSELATLKAGIANAQRNSSAQFGKLTERLDRTEKAQAEPTAKLAKIQESIDRLDRRPQQAAATRRARARQSPARSTPKEESKPQIAEGWRLRDFYDGRAIVESRNGTLVPGRSGIERAGSRQGRDHQARERQGRGGDRQRHHRRVDRAAASGLLLSLVT